jgi:aminopeptidase YwaD
VILRNLRLDLLALLVSTAFMASSCSVIHVQYLAKDERAGRDNGTPGSLAAQNYIIDVVSLYAQGLNNGILGDAAFKQEFPSGTNILAVIPGTDLSNEYVMVGAHYDHLTSCSVADAGDTICNGATDNAAGVAAVLEVARMLAEPENTPKRSVILAFWDSEEDGLLGSTYYVNNPVVPIENTVAYINFDIMGANLLPSLRQVSFAVGAETGGTAFVSAVEDSIATQSLNTRLISAVFGQSRSDYATFISAGVPTVFFTDSTGPCYHTTGDDLSVVDFGKLLKQTAIATDLTLKLSNGLLTPTFNASAPLATYDDALTLDAVAQLAINDVNRFSTADQDFIFSFASQLAAIVAEGRSNFDSADINAMLLPTIQMVSLLGSGECDGFVLHPVTDQKIEDFFRRAR